MTPKQAWPARSEEHIPKIPPFPTPNLAAPPAHTLSPDHWFHCQPPDESNLFDMFFDDAVMADLDSSILAAAKAGDSIMSQETVEPAHELSLDATNPGHLDISMSPAGLFTLPPTPDTMIHTGADKTQPLVSALASTKKSPTASIQSSFSHGGDTTPTPPALMQQLMQLSSIMYDLQSTYSPSKPSSWPTPPNPGSTFPTELAGNVLRIAIEFLRSLRCFLLPEESFSSTSSSSSAVSAINTGFSS